MYSTLHSPNTIGFHAYYQIFGHLCIIVIIGPVIWYFFRYNDEKTPFDLYNLQLKSEETSENDKSWKLIDLKSNTIIQDDSLEMKLIKSD